ncbi:hypothetical protein [Azotobacter vinelandii]
MIFNGPLGLIYSVGIAVVIGASGFVSGYFSLGSCVRLDDAVFHGFALHG